MSATLSDFSKWALDGARTAEERYLIFLICDECKPLEWHRLLPEERKNRTLQRADYRLHQMLQLNPLLMPEWGVEDTERAAAMAPFFIRFAPSMTGNHRRIGDAGAAFRFFPALEEIGLGECELRDISFVEALPALRKLHLSSAVLVDLGPLAKCAALRDLSLGFCSSKYPCLTPPLYWVDGRPLGKLKQLETLRIYPNAAILSGLKFPALQSADLSGENCVQVDCAYLPDMPELRLLKLEGPQSLRGIGRFPKLKHLRIAGPVRDFGDIAELKHLSCLDVQTQNGWPTDVTPLTNLPELLWVNFAGEIPRNYWPLTNAPRLCEVELQCPSLRELSVRLDVQAINAVLRPWDEEFHLPELRPRQRLRFIAVGCGGDMSVLPRNTEAQKPDYLAHPKLFHLELKWMYHRAQEVLARFDAMVEPRHSGPCENTQARSLSLEIQTFAAAHRFPEILEALREMMAASPHDWSFHIWMNLRITKLELTPQQKKWLEKIESDNESDWDDDSHEYWKKTQEHLIETQFRLRTSKEEGETPNPEDFEPPDEILPKIYDWEKPVLVGPQSEVADENDDTDAVDFELKPFDEQEQDGGEDDDDDDDEGKNVKIAPPPEPPEDFLEDPYAHPLADSYLFFATLTFDTLYHHGSNLATVEQLMGRPADEYYPGPDETE